MNAFGLIEHLSNLQDYRQPWKVEHVIGGAKSWIEIEDFGKLRELWLKTMGDFSFGIPSHDTIERVISKYFL